MIYNHSKNQTKKFKIIEFKHKKLAQERVSQCGGGDRIGSSSTYLQFIFRGGTFLDLDRKHFTRRRLSEVLVNKEV